MCEIANFICLGLLSELHCLVLGSKRSLVFRPCDSLDAIWPTITPLTNCLLKNTAFSRMYCLLVFNWSGADTECVQCRRSWAVIRRRTTLTLCFYWLLVSKPGFNYWRKFLFHIWGLVGQFANVELIYVWAAKLIISQYWFSLKMIKDSPLMDWRL